jgi:hypothetical protein
MKFYTQAEKVVLFERNEILTKNCLDFEDCPHITFEDIENGKIVSLIDYTPLSWDLIEKTLNAYPGY